MKKLFTAKSIVQRDALRARLDRYGITSITAERDVSRKLTEATLDLSLGAYSAMSPGFAVHVDDADLDEGEKILAQFLRETEGTDEPSRDDPWRRYYACAIFSLMMPGLMTVPATWHLTRAIRTGPPRNWAYFTVATICFAAGWVGVVLFVRNLISAE